MMKITKQILFFLLWGSSIHAHFIHEARLWDIISFTRHHNKWSYLLHFEGRFRYTKEPFTENFNRVAISYQFHPRMSAWLGYDLFTTVDQRVPDRQEVWQALRFVLVDNDRFNAAYHCSVQERTKFHTPGVVWQTRQLVAAKFKKAFSERVSPFIVNDLFVTFNKTEWHRVTGINQNRLYVGIAIEMKPDYRWEVGYMNRILIEADARNRMQHIAYIALLMKK